MILIVTNQDDLTADYLITHLQSRGLRYYRLNSDEIHTAQVTIELGGESNRRSIRSGPKVVELSEITSAWYRRSVSPTAPDFVSLSARRFVVGELQHLAEGMILGGDVRWVNSISATRMAERKLFQLNVANAVGLKTPKTLVTNDANAVASFFRSGCGEVITKPIYHGYWAKSGGDRAAYTRELGKAGLPSQEQLDACPCLIQTRIQKGSDIRLTLVGCHAFAVRIRTPPGSLVDWRHPEVDTRYEECTIPTEVMSACRRLMDRLGLVYGAIDLIQARDGDWYFLEVNPAGEWAWLERQLKLPISDALINLLTQG